MAGAFHTDRPELVVAVEGGPTGFPRLADVALALKALSCQRAALGRCTDPPSADELRRALPPVKFPVVRNVFASVPGASARGHGLAADSRDRRAQAASAAVASASFAGRLGASWLVLEIGGTEPQTAPSDPFDLHGSARSAEASPVSSRHERDRDLLADRLCRVLHEVDARVPGVGLAVLTPGLDELPTPAILEAVLEDLGPRRLQYWHDPSRAKALAQQGGPAEELWLDRFADRCVGVDLCDGVAGLHGLPAGSGEVDFVALRSALSRQTIGVVRAEPDPGPGPLLEAIRVLRAAGF